MSLTKSQIVCRPSFTERSIAGSDTEGPVPMIHVKAIGQAVLPDAMIHSSAGIPDILVLWNQRNELPQFDGRSIHGCVGNQTEAPYCGIEIRKETKSVQHFLSACCRLSGNRTRCEA